ncbi:MAG TPA: hypothetical protein VEJ63_09835 [Planctomycetota bacterium]|nr:hypothetical protein [Planctomycetota bacterium]
METNFAFENFQKGFALAWFDLRNGRAYRNCFLNEIEAAGYDYGRVLYRTPVLQCYYMWLEMLGLSADEMAKLNPIPVDPDTSRAAFAETKVISLDPGFADAI